MDNPHATKLVLRILAAFAQHDWENISKNAKATAQERKKKGVKRGTNGKKLSPYYKRQQRIQDRKIGPLLRKLHRQGLTLRAIAAELTRRKIKNLRGGTT